MLSTLLLSVLVSAAAPEAQPQAQASQTTQQGEPLYDARCAMCHDAGVARATNRDGLKRLSPDVIRQMLTTGSMSTQAAGLNDAQIDSLASFLGSTVTAKAGDTVA